MIGDLALIMITMIGLGIVVLFLADARSEIAKNTQPGNPDYGKGEFWQIVWGIFLLALVGKLIWVVVSLAN